MGFVEIEEKQDIILVNIEKVLMFKLAESLICKRCCVVLSDNSVIWCDEKYFDVLKSNIELL